MHINTHVHGSLLSENQKELFGCKLYTVRNCMVASNYLFSSVLPLYVSSHIRLLLTANLAMGLLGGGNTGEVMAATSTHSIVTLFSELSSGKIAVWP